MVRDLLIRGMLAGFIAGLLCFVVAKTFGEPQVDWAIAFEDAHSKPAKSREAAGAMDHEHEEELVSRHVQSTWGLLTAVTVYGAAMGGLFAIAFSFLYGRIGSLSPRLLSLLLALAAFAALYYVPSLKYPSNPPAIGEPETIGYRTGLYLLMILISLGAMIFSVAAARRFAERQPPLDAVLAGVAIFAVTIIAAQIILPSVNEVPSDFPATVLWNFRMASLGMQVMTWGTIGILFGFLAERVVPVTGLHRN
jgi:predicted cobalt transporter CbtA